MPKSLRGTRGAWLVASSTAFAAQPSGEPVASPGVAAQAAPREVGPSTPSRRRVIRRPVAVAPASAPTASSTGTDVLDVGPAVLKAAVAAPDTDVGTATRLGPFGPKEASPQTKLDRAFQSAQIEGCASGGALKFDPVPVWGDFVMGIFAVPYTLHAMATGRCKLLSR